MRCCWVIAATAVLGGNAVAPVSAVDEGIHPIIMAGDPNGEPPDTPDDRIDPNVPTSRYGGVVSIRTGVNAVSTGTIISPYHILCAAHSFDRNNDGVNDVRADVGVNINLYGDFSTVLEPPFIRSTSLHPDFTGFNNPSANDDIAIITLHWPLADDVPIYDLYREAPALGDRLELVGYGRSGNGVWGYSTMASYNVKRSGENIVDLFFLDDEGSGVAEVWEYDFDGPEGNGTMGGPTLGNDIETTIGAGDSGGPGFIDVAGEPLLYSVNTYRRDGFGEFGTGGGGMLVPAYLDWIDSFLAYSDPILGDLNLDGFVNDLDLLVFLPGYGGVMGEPGYAPGSDLNRDGLVSQHDLGILLANFTYDKSAVPAPGTIVVFALALPCLSRRRQPDITV
ncbi:MAG: hypothetical protein KAS72_04005 [Phycisphaerales bacterium]|nr:hypothetical protein [Phycisphaerales bacterium]